MEEDVAELGFYPREGDFTEGRKGEAETDMVNDPGSLTNGLEGVAVDPVAVGAADLLVDKLGGWIPDGDACAPACGDTVDTEFVVDEGADFHFDGGGGQDAKADAVRRDSLEVECVAEEGEDLIAGCG